MKIVKLSTSTFPPKAVQLCFDAFVRELELLSQRFGIGINSTGGYVAFDPSRDQIIYRQNPCGDLEPEISEIDKLKTAAAPFDFSAFLKELRELSGRHDVRLVSIGALSGLDSGNSGTTYLAIWSGEELLKQTLAASSNRV